MNRETDERLLRLLEGIKALKDLPVMKLAQNKRLLAEIREVVNGKGLARLVGDLQARVLAERNESFDQKRASTEFAPESLSFLRSHARFRGAVYRLHAADKKTPVAYTAPVSQEDVFAMNGSPATRAEKSKSISKAVAALPEAKEFQEAFNSIFSDHALQIGTQFDPTRISSYIDYSPYTYNYQYYLSIPTLSQTIDRGIQIATREPPTVEFEDKTLTEEMARVLKRSRFVEKLRQMLLFSHLSPRGALIVPIRNVDGTVRFNILNDTQFTYSTGYQYARLDFHDDGGPGVRQIFALGTLLQNDVTAHFLCPGFEPLYAIGKNRLFQLKEAAEAINIYLYTIKVLCIRAQVIVQKWGGEGQNDTLLAKMQSLTEDINSSLSLNTAVQIPEGSEFTLLNNNLSEGFSKISPIIKEFQGMLSGVMPDYFYGSDTAYSANSFNIHATHQTIRSDVQEGQIEPIYRYVVNRYLEWDKRFAKWSGLVDDFDVEFPSLYEPTDAERATIDAARIDSIIKMADYPELAPIFKSEGLLAEQHNLPEKEPVDLSGAPGGEPVDDRRL